MLKYSKNKRIAKTQFRKLKFPLKIQKNPQKKLLIIKFPTKQKKFSSKIQTRSNSDCGKTCIHSNFNIASLDRGFVITIDCIQFFFFFFYFNGVIRELK
jgi:hypothetical protein